MIEANRSTATATTDGSPRRARTGSNQRCVMSDEATARSADRPAPAPEPRPCTPSLQALLTDGSRIAWRDRSSIAFQAFTAGNCFIPGQIIDRAI